MAFIFLLAKCSLFQPPCNSGGHGTNSDLQDIMDSLLGASGKDFLPGKKDRALFSAFSEVSCLGTQ